MTCNGWFMGPKPYLRSVSSCVIRSCSGVWWFVAPHDEQQQSGSTCPAFIFFSQVSSSFCICRWNPADGDVPHVIHCSDIFHEEITQAVCDEMKRTIKQQLTRGSAPVFTDGDNEIHFLNVTGNADSWSHMHRPQNTMHELPWKADQRLRTVQLTLIAASSVLKTF